MVVCPICNKQVRSSEINGHIDSGCETHILETSSSPPPSSSAPPPLQQQQAFPFSSSSSASQKRSASSFFQAPSAKRQAVGSRVVTLSVANNQTAGAAGGEAPAAGGGTRAVGGEIPVVGGETPRAAPAPAPASQPGPPPPPPRTAGVKRGFDDGPGQSSPLTAEPPAEPGHDATKRPGGTTERRRRRWPSACGRRAWTTCLGRTW